MQSLFAPASLSPLYALSQVDLILFMFLVGVERIPAFCAGQQNPPSLQAGPV
jgi:hypothetical protein